MASVTAAAPPNPKAASLSDIDAEVRMRDETQLQLTNRKFTTGGRSWHQHHRSKSVEALHGNNLAQGKGLDGNQTSSEDNVNVVVRVRPLNKLELGRNDNLAVQFPGNGVLWTENNQSIKPFTFNVLFEPEASQKDVFEHSGMKKLVNMAVDGYACTCFAFGQTGSGKTHTITGPPQQFQPGRHLERTDYGLIPRCFQHLLQVVQKKENSEGSTHSIKASFYELYNEQVIDLLNPRAVPNLSVRWSKNKGFYIENLFTIQCETFDDLMQVLEEGVMNRTTSAHNMNDFSSRSHSMLQLNVESDMQDPHDESLYITKHGKLTFVDLAGSEKVKDTLTSGDQLIETNNINKSLLVLGKCIAALGDPKKRNGHIPYRDSKLTKLLADSIGGSGVTLMIACVSPSSYNLSETMNTLRYATRANRIRNKPVIKMDPRERLIMSLKKEIKLLRAENQYLREQLNFPLNKGANTSPRREKDMANSDHKRPQHPQSDGLPAKKTASEGGTKSSAPSEAAQKQDAQNAFTWGETDLYKMVQEYMVENDQLRLDNSDMQKERNKVRWEQEQSSRENERLQRKIDGLEKHVTKIHDGQPPSMYSSRQSSMHESLLSGPTHMHSGVSSASSNQSYRSYLNNGYPSPVKGPVYGDLPPVQNHGGKGGDRRVKRNNNHQGSNIPMNGQVWPSGQPFSVHQGVPVQAMGHGGEVIRRTFSQEHIHPIQYSPGLPLSPIKGHHTSNGTGSGPSQGYVYRQQAQQAYIHSTQSTPSLRYPAGGGGGGGGNRGSPGIVQGGYGGAGSTGGSVGASNRSTPKGGVGGYSYAVSNSSPAYRGPSNNSVYNKVYSNVSPLPNKPKPLPPVNTINTTGPPRPSEVTSEANEGLRRDLMDLEGQIQLTQAAIKGLR